MKFFLVVRDALPETPTPDFECPMMLEGNENIEYAIARFKDALAVFKHKLAVEEGRVGPLSSRIDWKQ